MISTLATHGGMRFTLVHKAALWEFCDCGTTTVNHKFGLFQWTYDAFTCLLPGIHVSLDLALIKQVHWSGDDREPRVLNDDFGLHVLVQWGGTSA